MNESSHHVRVVPADRHHPQRAWIGLGESSGVLELLPDRADHSVVEVLLVGRSAGHEDGA